jgi:transcriptional regulator
MNDVDLLPGTLDMLVMQALMHRAAHGYEIARFIGTHSRAQFRVIDGALYAALHRLERRGHVVSQWGQAESRKRAKFYVLTAAGRRACRHERIRWYRYITAVARVMTARPLEIDAEELSGAPSGLDDAIRRSRPLSPSDPPRIAGAPRPVSRHRAHAESTTGGR